MREVHSQDVSVALSHSVVGLPLATNSGVNVESSEEDDSSSEEETPAGKGAVVVRQFSWL